MIDCYSRRFAGEVLAVMKQGACFLHCEAAGGCIELCSMLSCCESLGYLSEGNGYLALRCYMIGRHDQ